MDTREGWPSYASMLAVSNNTICQLSPPQAPLSGFSNSSGEDVNAFTTMKVAQMESGKKNPGEGIPSQIPSVEIARINRVILFLPRLANLVRLQQMCLCQVLRVLSQSPASFQI